jgi:hypothetical protein
MKADAAAAGRQSERGRRCVAKRREWHRLRWTCGRKAEQRKRGRKHDISHEITSWFVDGSDLASRR